ncbi:MAG: bifunctional ornithine acetyltransferase/N-acetylglutamate synthase, partial [Candidatus Omnitrophica bacterium]|nr:bifunctional ornithine acetyltransferase/N-acetylglutamate synthase [Candidatus Omnitrophota bacterium]
YRNSAPGGIKREKLIKLLKKKEVEIDINLGSGKHEYSLLSCDLTCEYVRINTAYN